MEPARSFFQLVRESAIDASRTKHMLDFMESREGVKAQSYSAHVSGGASDPMRTTDARIDREAEWQRRIEWCYSVIDRACSVIYGDEPVEGMPAGGVEAMLGTETADVLWWRYCAAESWRVVSERCCHSQSWCYGAASAAFREIDALGVDLLAGLE